jgi:hypothetical protein
VLREYAHTTASNLDLRDGISFEDWRGVGCQIARISNGSSWWLGDWVNYGERAYGERYRSALDVTQLDYQTLRNYAWVARRFEASRRRERLSFQHHAEVAALPEADQDLWLDRTERAGWSRNELRRRLRAEQHPALPTGDGERATLRVPLTADRERRWREAAATAEKELIDWLMTTADQAADATLSARTLSSATALRRDDGSPSARAAERSRQRELAPSLRGRRLPQLGSQRSRT